MTTYIRPPARPGVSSAVLRRRRKRRLGLLIVLLIIAAGNGPILASYASTKYEEWRSHQPAYERRYGRWDVIGSAGVNSIHAALLNNGQVLMMAGSGNNTTNFAKKDFRTALWNPVTNKVTQVLTPWDVFCAGHTFLPNGDLLIAGGTKKYEILAADSPDGQKHEFQGLKDSYIYSPTTGQYTKVGDLNHARWYPSLVTLAAGPVLATSGLDQNGAIDPGNTETYDPTTKKWTDQPNLKRQFPTYPALIQMNDGRLFFSGANAGYGPAALNTRRPGLWNVYTNQFQPVTGLPDAAANETAGTVLLPPAQNQTVMFLGGGDAGDSQVASARTALVDLTAKNPVWKAGPDLSVKKRYPGVVILPDDTLLVSGGSVKYRAKDSKTAEIYDVASNSFSKAASPHVGRDYHSEYLLLPDGRVLVVGSNPLSDDNFFEQRMEVYSPPYLFQGTRPSILSSPKEIGRGTSIQVSSSQAVSKVRLIKAGAYTHVTDTDTRSVALPIVRSQGGRVQLSVPDNVNLLPAGWYMMFVDNAKNVPSVAAWVHVK